MISNDITNLYSEAGDSVDYQLREAFMDLYFSEADLRIGKQIISWGRAEGTFIADILSPVDLTEFLTQDFSDLRLGIAAIKYTHYFGSDYLQLVLNPVFNPSKIPTLDSRWFPTLPFVTSFPVDLQPANQQPKLKNMQLAGRYAFRSNLNFDLDIGLLYWNFPQPRYTKELQLQIPTGTQLNLTENYTQDFIAIYSGSYRLTDKLLFTSESAFYNRRAFDYATDQLRTIDLDNPTFNEIFQIGQIFDQNEDGFLKERPWLITMVGLQYEILNWNLNGQFINEHIFRYDNTILQEQDFYYATLSMQRSFFRDKLSFSTFGRYNFHRSDFWVNPELSYSGIDSFEASIGTHLFGGEQATNFYGHTSFGTYGANSFGYLKISAYF